MRKQLLGILVGAAIGAASLPAQTSALGSNFQQPGWIRYPDSGPNVWVGTLEGQSGPVQGRPFSATEVRHTTQVLTDGTHVDQSDISAFYRDGQGRMRSESPAYAVIYDPVSGFTYNLSLKSKTYTKNLIRNQAASVSIAVVGNRTSISSHSSTDIGPRQPTKGKGPRTAGPAVEDLPQQTMNGIGVRGSRSTWTIPAGTFGNDRDVKVVNERWYSDDLQVLVKSSNTDPRFGVTTYELTNITEVPPDAGLFQVPADYKPAMQGNGIGPGK